MWIIKSFVSILIVKCKCYVFFKVNRKQYPGGVTSLAMINKRLVLIGTDDGSIYQLDILTFDDALLSTCHTGAILDIAFPKVWYCHFFQLLRIKTNSICPKKNQITCQANFTHWLQTFSKFLCFFRSRQLLDD